MGSCNARKGNVAQWVNICSHGLGSLSIGTKVGGASDEHSFRSFFFIVALHAAKGGVDMANGFGVTEAGEPSNSCLAAQRAPVLWTWMEYVNPCHP